ncbi:MAG: peroxidase family protein [Deltaproteobacteria bacterium]|nr:peroxidase family protein [Deltaproteobacteria bacterium]
MNMIITPNPVPSQAASAVLGYPVRSFDGSRNNLENPDYGQAGAQLRRLTAPAYADGLSEPVQARPNARALSLAAFQAFQIQDTPAHPLVSSLLVYFGQFLDHTITRTPTQHHDDPMAVPVPANDPFFTLNKLSSRALYLARSIFDEQTGIANPRQQINELSAYIDGTAVYGDSEERAKALRANDDSGKLLTWQSADGETWLPRHLSLNNDDPFGNRIGENVLFSAGDVRSNENIALSAIHSLWVREHNRLCDQIKSSNPKLSGDEIYHCARKLVEALIQNITVTEFLPAILGSDGIGKYRCYNPQVNPGVFTEFSTAAYRMHTLLPDSIVLRSADGKNTYITLMDAFFKPELAVQHSLASYFEGLSRAPAEEGDLRLSQSLVNNLFAIPERGIAGSDLFVANVMRGRDHGLADFNTIRQSMGLSYAASFGQISDDSRAIKVLKAYADVKSIDLFVGGLAETKIPGALVGPTFHAIIRKQFEDMRNGDRFWFENDPFFTQNPQLLTWVRSQRFADVIRTNTNADVDNDVFRYAETSV